MTGELKRCCLFCDTIIITTSIDKLNSEVEKHIETCKNHQKILQDQKCVCGQKPKPSLIMHLKTKHFKIVGSISRFSSEGEDSNDESSDYSDNDYTYMMMTTTMMMRAVRMMNRMARMIKSRVMMMMMMATKIMGWIDNL